jgi:hypothetical protein
MQTFAIRVLFAVPGLFLLAACNGNGAASPPKSLGASTAMTERRYISEIYKAPSGSKIYDVRHHMLRIQHNGNVVYFPADSTYTTIGTDVLVKNSNDPSGVLVQNGAAPGATVVRIDVPGRVVVKPGESLKVEDRDTARLVEVQP